MTRHTVDHLLAKTFRPARAGLRLLRSCWALVCHRKGRAVRRVHTGVHTTGEGARGPGTLSFWTQPLNPLWLVGSDDGSVARSCTYP